MIVYLAHIGSFVPCERILLSIVDRIFTRIQSVESCTQTQSTFEIGASRCLGRQSFGAGIGARIGAQSEPQMKKGA